MPIAGTASEARALAHIGWAGRYNRLGDTGKAAAHFGRALDYADDYTKENGFGARGSWEERLAILRIRDEKRERKEQKKNDIFWNPDRAMEFVRSLEKGEFPEQALELVDEWLGEYPTGPPGPSDPGHSNTEASAILTEAEGAGEDRLKELVERLEARSPDIKRRLSSKRPMTAMAYVRLLVILLLATGSFAGAADPGCGVCGTKISNGKDGSVYNLKGVGTHSVKDWVVKVFVDENRQKAEERAYDVFNCIKREEPAFRPLDSKVVDGRLWIERFDCTLMDLTERVKGERVVTAAKMQDAGMSEAHALALFREFERMHDAGVAHCDVQPGNIGVIKGKGADGTRFVISDPTNLAVSPFFRPPAKPEIRRALELLRPVKLSEAVNASKDHIVARMKDGGIDPTEKLVDEVMSLIQAHNNVVAKMESDRRNLRVLFPGFLSEKK